MKKKSPKLSDVPLDHEAYNVLAEVRELAHDHLADAHIALLWILEPKTRKGKRVLGLNASVPERWYRISGVDRVIEIDHSFWQSATDAEKRYLIDHELCHFAPTLDESGDQATDLTGRRLYTSVPHDVEEFAGPVSRWGVQNTDLRRFHHTVHEQLTLDFDLARFMDSPDGGKMKGALREMAVEAEENKSKEAAEVN